MSAACFIRFTLSKSSGISLRAASFVSCRLMSSDPMPLPSEDLNQAKKYTPKVTQIVDQIEKLTLLEVADLNELLKVKRQFLIVSFCVFKLHFFFFFAEAIKYF